ncbi:Uncharacterised protein [Mycobacteroides abscessus subsp. massiliense]|nr:Uncharacterised protein [Mycobacteroides abscessus subsp. massiliense]
MVAHEEMIPSAARSKAVSNASAGMTRFMNIPTSVRAPVTAMPMKGTPPEVIRDNTFGALPFIARDRRIRPVLYRPAFRLDSAAVSTTKFMASPAYGTPIREKKVTKGLSPAL